MRQLKIGLCSGYLYFLPAGIPVSTYCTCWLYIIAKVALRIVVAVSFAIKPQVVCIYCKLLSPRINVPCVVYIHQVVPVMYGSNGLRVYQRICDARGLIRNTDV